MNTRDFGAYLVCIAAGAALIAGVTFGFHKNTPPSRSEEGVRMRQRMSQGIGTLEERFKLDALYAADKDLPPLTKYLLITAAAAGLLGGGLILSSPAGGKQNALEDTRAQASTVAHELQALTELKEKGALTDEEFTQAKARLLG